MCGFDSEWKMKAAVRLGLCSQSLTVLDVKVSRHRTDSRKWRVLARINYERGDQCVVTLHGSSRQVINALTEHIISLVRALCRQYAREHKRCMLDSSVRYVSKVAAKELAAQLFEEAKNERQARTHVGHAARS